MHPPLADKQKGALLKLTLRMYRHHAAPECQFLAQPSLLRACSFGRPAPQLESSRNEQPKRVRASELRGREGEETGTWPYFHMSANKRKKLGHHNNAEQLCLTCYMLNRPVQCGATSCQPTEFSARHTKPQGQGLGQDPARTEEDPD